MTQRISAAAPAFILKRDEGGIQEPYIEVKSFHGQRYLGWVGHVKFKDIDAWMDNPRTEYLKLKFQLENGVTPTGDQLCQMMVNDDYQEEGMKIKELADSIELNGLRQPLILTMDGCLLDGNRRYSALWLIRKARQSDVPADAEDVPVWVMASGLSDREAVFDVVTDLNFVEDNKLPWKQYVKAKTLYDEWNKGIRGGEGATLKELAARYMWPENRVRSHVETAALIEEFMLFHENSPKTLKVAYEHFIWFEQLYRSNSRLLNDDNGFKESIFGWILPLDDEEACRFQQARDFSRLTEIRKSPNAWEVLESKTGPGSLKAALYIVDGEKTSLERDPVSKMRKITREIQDLRENGDLEKLGTEILDSFHEVSSTVPGAPPDAEARLEKMVSWLNDLKVSDMRELSFNALEKLREALQTVTSMADVVRAESFQQRTN